MRSAQKIIKILALALAAFIIFVMFAALVGGVSFMASIAGGESWRWDGNDNWTSEDFADQKIRELDINAKATNVKFRAVDSGDDVRVETNNEYISTWTNGERLELVEKSHGIFGWGGTGEVVIYLRKDVKLRNVKLEVGAGALTIDRLETERLSLNLGAGRTEIDNLKVTENTQIDGGAGLLVLRSGELRDANLELGVGKAEIVAKLTGHSKIDSGVGKLDLDLIGKEKDYRIKIDKGIGNVDLNGQSMPDGAIWGDGNNEIEVESGVGAVEIKISEE